MLVLVLQGKNPSSVRSPPSRFCRLFVHEYTVPSYSTTSFYFVLHSTVTRQFSRDYSTVDSSRDSSSQELHKLLRVRPVHRPHLSRSLPIFFTSVSRSVPVLGYPGTPGTFPKSTIRLTFSFRNHPPSPAPRYRSHVQVDDIIKVL